MRRGLRVMLIVVGVCLLACAAVWGVGLLIGKRAFARALAGAWPLGLGPASTLPNRFPGGAMSASAARLVLDARVIGIDLQPKTGPKVHPEKKFPDAEKAYDGARKQIDDYQRDEVLKADDAIDVPPAEAVAFLDTNATKIATLRDDILQAPDIRWEIDLSRYGDAPIPNLLGHMKIAKLFTTDALVKARNNDPKAWDDLHAIWQLDRGLRDRPDLLSQLIVIAMVRMTNAAARKLTPPAPPWLAEMQTYDYRRSLVAAQQADAWTVAHTIAGSGGTKDDEMTLPQSFRLLSAASLLEHHRRAAIDVATTNTCAFKGDEFDARHLAAIPTWDIVARIAMSPVGGMYQRQIHLLPEFEATSRLLQLKEARAASATNEWPASLADTTSRCSDGSWVYEKNANGSASLKFSTALPPLKISPQPLEFSLVR